MSRPLISDIPSEVAIRTSRVSGITKRSALGHSDAVGTNLRPLYHDHNTGDLAIAALLATPAVVKISSTSGNDAVAQSGALTVNVIGVDENGVAATEAVILTGQTAVTTTTLFKAVEKIQVTSAGATGSNEGVIWAGTGTVTAGVPATKYNSVEIGTNVSALCLIVVPAEREFLASQLSIFSGDTSKLLNFQFYQYSAATGLWYEAFDVHGKQSDLVLPVSGHPPLVAGDAVMLRVNVDTSTAIITASIVGYTYEV